MIKLSNSKLILVFTQLLILLVIAKSIALGLWWYLPSDGVELSLKENYQPKYQRVNFKNMISSSKTKEANQVKQRTGSGISITNMVLKGLYGKDEKGFVIVAMKSNAKKTSIIEVGEDFGGYTLKSIFITSAKFHKNGSDFILSLEKIKNPSTVTEVRSKRSNSNRPIEAKVNRKDIEFYAKNPKQIWKDISIQEVKDGKKIKGFKVTKIGKNTRFAELGLKKGDLIIKANNVRLQSYSEALEIYKNIDKLDTIQIVVMRNNQEVELVYEIN
jgi:general secretion pathway protein C